MKNKDYNEKLESTALETENMANKGKAKWQTPELFVISMDQTHSGTNFVVPSLEGVFYNPGTS